MAFGLHLYSAFLTRGHSKCFTILPKSHPFIHTFIHRRQWQPCKVTSSSSAAVRVRGLAQGIPRYWEARNLTSDRFWLPVNPFYLLSHSHSVTQQTFWQNRNRQSAVQFFPWSHLKRHTITMLQASRPHPGSPDWPWSPIRSRHRTSSHWRLKSEKENGGYIQATLYSHNIQTCIKHVLSTALNE